MEAQGEKKICAVVLAAGLSKRMGADKLLLPYKGVALAEHMLRCVAQSGVRFTQRLLVGRTPQMQALAQRYGFLYVHNPQPQCGMGHSLALGVAQAGPCDGFLLALADMPDLKPGTLYTLCTQFAKDPARITVPVYGARRGNPVVFPARLRPELCALCGDEGGRALLAQEAQSLARVQCYDPGILRDVDTPADLAR